MSNGTATIERIDTGPFRSYMDRQGKVWAIIFHTSQGREMFAEYNTHADARKDAVKYGINITRRVAA